ncbi:MAG: hypothetical protein NVSMB10_19100 [Steroidobacteraceae bacterium]
MSFMDVLAQYAGQAGTPPAKVDEHFTTVAQQAPPQLLGAGIAGAMRSDATPSFGDTVAKLFGNSNPDQKSALLNHLAQALGPAAASLAGSGILGRFLGAGAAGTSTSITPAQAAQVSPTDVSAMAAHAERANGSIIDTVSAFYAQHPALVQTLGAAALAATMSHMQANAGR